MTAAKRHERKLKFRKLKFVVLFILTSLGLTCLAPVARAWGEPPSTADGEVPVTRIHTAYAEPSLHPGVFLDKTYSLPYVPDALNLTGSNTSTAPYSVDDEIKITVAHLDDGGSLAQWSHDYSNGCTASSIIPTPANEVLNVRSLLKPGRNIIRVTFIDRCSPSRGSSDIYFEGVHMTQIAGDRSDSPDDLYAPGKTDRGEYSDCSTIVLGQRFVEFAGPILLGDTVVAMLG